LSSTKQGSGLISQAVHEALSTLVSPAICEQLIRRSLRSFGLIDVPEQGSEVVEWLEQALRPAVEDAVGADAAELLVSQLAPMAAYAALSKPKIARAATPTPSRGNTALVPARDDSDVPPATPFRSRPARSTNTGIPTFEHPHAEREPTRPFRVFQEAPPRTGTFEGTERITLISEPDNANELVEMSVQTLPPPNGFEAKKTDPRDTGPIQRPSPARPSAFVTLPVVLAATISDERVRSLEHYLDGTAAVAQIADLAGLLDALASPIRSERLLLIDCVQPTVHVKTVAAIRQDLPAGTTVVVWGIDEATWNQLEREKTAGSRWVRCSHEASTDDVGSLCSMLLG
jgi:hypothetical protein